MHISFDLVFVDDGPHSLTKIKFPLKTHLRSFYEDSDIYQCFPLWDLFLEKNKI